LPGITFAKKVTKWAVTSNAVIINASDLPSLQADGLELQALQQEAMELGNLQIALEAQFQQVSRDLEEKLRQGEALVARVRSGVRAEYGYLSEKLREFGLRPFRRRKGGSGSTPTPPPPPVEASKLPAPDPIPAT
jgi:hypothetical protein